MNEWLFLRLNMDSSFTPIKKIRVYYYSGLQMVRDKELINRSVNRRSQQKQRDDDRRVRRQRRKQLLHRDVHHKKAGALPLVRCKNGLVDRRAQGSRGVL